MEQTEPLWNDLSLCLGVVGRMQRSMELCV
jgi:hypothetical protein